MLDRRHATSPSDGLFEQAFYTGTVKRRGTEVFLILLVIVLLALFWDRLRLPWKTSASAQVAAHSAIQVWVNKKSGFYYCPDSKSYGKLKPGFFMPQYEAMQAGYRPPFNGTCK